MNRSFSPDPADFVDGPALERALETSAPSPSHVREILAKSLQKQALTVEETACLLRATDPEAEHEIFRSARTLKEDVYGNRVVLFAPLYLGNDCINDCLYCGFRRSNKAALRRTLNPEQLRDEIVALERMGHKRLILVFGEHPRYDAESIAQAVRSVYAVKTAGKGEAAIRRVNVNAAPFDVDGFRVIKDSGIGTYQVFQETYHRPTYARVHPQGTRKGDYLWRLGALDRAMEGGCDDVGIGALFGLYDWRFEVLGLVCHALHLQQRHGVGPHTISFPRLRPAGGVDEDWPWRVSDAELLKAIAVLRLAVPYTGLILTARESGAFRREAMALGVSQIDAGSRIALGGYAESTAQDDRFLEQFELDDERPLDQIMANLMEDGYTPSFCTACYRLGRTGEHFMEFAVPGFIKRYCTPNALTTLMEYLVDNASPQTRAAGERRIALELASLEEGPMKQQLRESLRRIRENGDHDLFF